MNIKAYLNEHIVYLDGGMGTQLQAQGLGPGERPELWNLSHPEAIIAVHRAYFEAGSNVVCTNTFGANCLKFSGDELEAIVKSALDNARAARDTSAGEQEKFIALDIGPTGKLLAPLGDLDFEEAVAVFAHTVKLGVQYGAELIVIETMSDAYETKAALLAAKENSTLPVFVTNAYGEAGRLMTGASPAAMVALLEGMGADAVGANCSLGPRQLYGVAEELLENASVPVILKPNAGLPRVVDGVTHFDVSAEEFAAEVAALVDKGVRVVGGCCGTTPAYIQALTAATAGKQPVPLTDKELTVVSSYTHTVSFGEDLVVIGERLNPTGRNALQKALLAGDIDVLVDEGMNQQDEGAQILDVNVGLPGVDETTTLTAAIGELQTILNLPLQIDTADSAAMAAALRRYNGKAMINSVTGEAARMEAVFPLAKKYGGVVVALTMDENGIPATAEGRVAIARRIVEAAADWGIDKKHLLFDPLALPVSTDDKAAAVTLEALRRIRQELGCHTVLGISNISFGLPGRDYLNSQFLTLALENGLSAAILNPGSAELQKALCAHRLLKGLDPHCAAYIASARTFADSAE